MKKYKVYYLIEEELDGTPTEIHCRDYVNEEEAIERVQRFKRQGFDSFYEIEN